MIDTAKPLRWFAAAFVLAAAVPAHAQFSAFTDPAGYWSFDTCYGTTVRDYAMTRHDGTQSGGGSCSTFARFGKAGYFDGVDDRVDVQNSTGMNYTRLTVSAWVYPQASSGTRTIINKWYTLDSWGLFLNNGSWQWSVVFPGGTWGVPVTVTYPATLNTWTFVTGVYDGAAVRLYVNGTQVASAAASGNPQSSTRPIVIGNHPTWNAFQGYIDEVKLYSSALSATQVAHQAANPSSLGVRGLHLFPSRWSCWTTISGCDAGIVGKFRDDLGRIHSISNINSIKTTIFSQGGNTFWLDRQNEKLRALASATGNHTTWILRAWPEPSDCPSGTPYYTCGYNFARSLVGVFSTLNNANDANSLRLDNVYIEVANEPNIADSGQVPFYDPNFGVMTARYNDFFRGFYDGERSVGYTFPLTYAGLTPGCSDAGGGNANCTADAWYQDYWVRYHIQTYASKVGVHVYWASLTPSAWNGRQGSGGGYYYRRVRNILGSTAYTPAVSPHGLQMSEFNLNRAAAGASTATQATEMCSWWQGVRSDGQSGYWTEQGTVFVTTMEGTSFQNEYWVTNDQLDDIRNCP